MHAWFMCVVHGVVHGVVCDVCGRYMVHGAWCMVCVVMHILTLPLQHALHSLLLSSPLISPHLQHTPEVFLKQCNISLHLLKLRRVSTGNDFNLLIVELSDLNGLLECFTALTHQLEGRREGEGSERKKEAEREAD